MDQGRKQHLGSLQRSAPASTQRSILRGLLVAVAILTMPWMFAQALAQQRADKYAGYSPSSKAEERAAKKQAAKKQAAKRQAAKKQAAKKQAAKKMGQRASVAKVERSTGRKVVAKARTSGKRDGLAAKSSTPRSLKVARAAPGVKGASSRDARLKRAQVVKAAAAKPAARRTVSAAKKPVAAMQRAKLPPKSTIRSVGGAGVPTARLQAQSTMRAGPNAKASGPVGKRTQSAAAKSAPAAMAAVSNLGTVPPGKLGGEAERSASAAAKSITPTPAIAAGADNTRVAERSLVTPASPAAATSATAAKRAGATRRAVTAAPPQGIVGPWAGLPLMIGTLGGFLFYRRRQLQPQVMEIAPHIDPTMHMPSVDVAAASQQVKADLMQRAEPFFVDLRNASVRQDHDFILQHCTEDMATALILDSAIADTPAEPHVEGLRAELVDLFEEVNRYVASVQYTADEQQGGRRPRKVNEVWHFVREPEAPDWRLAAVEPG